MSKVFKMLKVLTKLKTLSVLLSLFENNSRYFCHLQATLVELGKLSQRLSVADHEPQLIKNLKLLDNVITVSSPEEVIALQGNSKLCVNMKYNYYSGA